MKLRWFAVAAALIVAASMVACDDDAIGPSNTGDVTIRLVFDSKTVSSQSRTDDVEIAPGQQPRASRAVVGSAIDKVHIQLRGPDTLTRQVTPSSGTATASFSKILVGSYSVLVELVDAGAVSHVGTGSLRVNADVNNEATITAQSYTPSIDTAPDATTEFAFDLTWSTAAVVDSGYVIQWSTNPSFTGAMSDSVPPPSTSYTASVLQTGSTYYRVRAGGTRALAGALGKWSDPHRVDVEADTLPARIPVATFPISFSANIDVPGATDQFTLWACRTDTLTVQVTALGLTPPSPLDPFISAAGVQSQNADQDESLLVVLTTDDSVTVTVGGESGSVGHYDVLIDLGFGQFNNQDGTCVPSAAQLAFTQFPGGIAAGDVMIPELKVQAWDTSGARVSDFTGDITLSFDSDPSGGQASLLGTTTVAAVSGEALFTDISVDKTANGYTLRATSGTLAPGVSNSFNVTPTNPSSVGIIDGDMQTGEAGTQLPTAPAVEVSDAFGNPVPGVTVEFVPSGDGFVSSPTAVTDASGFALVNWTLGTPVATDSDTLTAFVPDVDTVRFIATATPGTPNRVFFSVEPRPTAAGDIFTPRVDVHVLDSLGNLVTTATDNVSIAIGDDPNGGIAALGGTLTIAASGGIAGFTDLSIDLDGADYTLVVTSGSLVPDTTSAFRVMPSGTSTYWTAGTGSTDWSDPGNWSTGVVPDSADGVFIGPEPSFVPTLTQDVSIVSIHVEDGVTLETNGFTLTVSETVVGGSTIAGTGWVVMTGNGAASGEFPNLRITGDVNASGYVGVNGNLEVSGTFRLTGQQVFVNDTFSTTAGTGILGMDDPADTMWVGGDAVFGGGDLSGFLTAGHLFVRGTSFTSTASASFRAEGTHTVHLDAPGTDTVYVSIADPPNSPFNNVTMPQFPTIVLQSPIAVNGTLISPNTGIPVIVGDTITVQGVDVDGLRLDGAPIVIGQGSITQFDNVTFVNFGPGERQLTVMRDGGSFTFSGLQFSQDNPGSDIYVSANDLAPTDGDVLTIELAASNPLTAEGTSGEEELNGAVINWAEPPALIQFTSADTTLASLLDSYSPGITIEDQFGIPLLRTDVNWSSHDPGVASVTADGVVTANTTGFARIRATSPVNPAIADSIIVTVSNAPASIELDRTLDTLFVLADTLRYRATVRNARGDSIPGAPVGWGSSDLTAATIGGTGLATSVGVGQTFIIGTAAALADSATLVVLDTLMPDVASVDVTPSGRTLAGVGATVTLTAQARDSAGAPVGGTSATWASLNPNVATVDPATGVATAVGSGQATIQAAVDTILGFALVTVTDPAAVPVNLWTSVASPTGQDLEAVWGSSATDVHAVGAAGTILRFDGAQWDTVTNPNANNLFGVWGTSTNNIYAVGTTGSILRYDGAQWLGVPNPVTGQLQDVWGSSPDDVFAVGINGTIAHFDGSQWIELTNPTSGLVEGVWGRSADDVFVVGGTNDIHRYDGVLWTPMTNPTADGLNAVWGTDSNDVYAVGLNGRVLQFNGTQWTALSPPVGFPELPGVWGSAPTDVYVVGQGGLILRYDGSQWTSVTMPGLPSPMRLRAAWGTSGGSVHVVGDFGTIVTGYRGATVAVTPDTTLTSVGDTITLRSEARDGGGVLITDAIAYRWSSNDITLATVDSLTGLVTAVGNGSAAITATAPGGAASSATVTVQQVATSVLVTPSGASVSVGGGPQTFGVEARDANNSLLASPSVTWSSLNTAVATIGTSNGQASGVGAGQVVISAEVDGVFGYGVVTSVDSLVSAVNLWADDSSGTPEGLNSVWGTSGSNIYAVGNNSTVLRFDGTAWSPENVAVGNSLSDVWGTSSSDVLVTSLGAAVLRFDGNTWGFLTGAPATVLNDIWAASPEARWVVGAGGTIAFHDGAGWTTLSSGTMEELRAVWGSAADDLFAVGTGGTILHSNDGTSWSPMTSNVSVDLFDIWGASSTDVFAVGDSGMVVRYNGSVWTPFAQLTSRPLTSIWGSSSADVYVGRTISSVVYRFDGSVWNVEVLPESPFGIWGQPQSPVFAVGTSGSILRGFRGATVTASPDTTLTALGDTVTLVAEARDAGSNLISGVSFTWTSLDPDTATVNPVTGLVTAVGNGTATITATAPGGASGSATILVASGPQNITIVEGDAQTGLVGFELNVAPTVLVQDVFSNPLQGVTVNSTVTAGGGSISSSTAVTDASGIASVNWTLGGSAGINSLQATVSGTSLTANFTATGITSQYNIDLRFLTSVDSATGAAFDSALAKWTLLVIGELTDIPMNISAGQCGSNSPALNETVDDVLIWATVEPIDGPGGVLGSAGPCFIRTTGNLSVVGMMLFDVADVPSLLSAGEFDEVVLHEMGHVLGYGTLWSTFGFLENPSLPSSPGVDTHFDGPLAIEAFDDLGGTSYTGGSKVPVENTQGGSGTRDSHWRETVFVAELMTGFLDSGVPNPLSRLSVASLWDMGYTVNLAGADSYSQVFMAPPPEGRQRIHLMNDIYTGPIYAVDASGRIVRQVR